tara:strand:+ start:521 stop:679 length:159 start_codon:yes stop_codon:yes gene_type:complete
LICFDLVDLAKKSYFQPKVAKKSSKTLILCQIFFLLFLNKFFIKSYVFKKFK